MLAMAELGLVHVLSSDAHSSAHGRPVALSPALERLAASSAWRRTSSGSRRRRRTRSSTGAELEVPYPVAL